MHIEILDPQEVGGCVVQRFLKLAHKAADVFEENIHPDCVSAKPTMSAHMNGLMIQITSNS